PLALAPPARIGNFRITGGATNRPTETARPTIASSGDPVVDYVPILEAISIPESSATSHGEIATSLIIHPKV
ncbi:MAG: hypothetical protein ACYDDA_15015, partial [Acidiferrobacteraceae bacterium]